MRSSLNKLLLFILFHFLFKINSVTLLCDVIFTGGLSAVKNEIKGIDYLFFIYKYQQIYEYAVIDVTSPYLHV